MQVPEGGQQEPFTGNGLPIVSHFARRGDCLRGALSHMSRIVIAMEMLSGLGIGLGLGFGMFAPFGDGALGGASVPRFPCTFGAAVTWGYSRCGPSGAACRPVVSGAAWHPIVYSRCGPSGAACRPVVSGAAWHPIVSRCGLPSNCFSVWLAIQLSLSVACRPMISRGGLAYRCRAPWQTWLKGNGKTGNRRSASRKKTLRRRRQARSAFPPPRPRE